MFLALLLVLQALWCVHGFAPIQRVQPNWSRDSRNGAATTKATKATTTTKQPFEDHEYLERVLAQNPAATRTRDVESVQKVTPTSTLHHLVSLLLQHPELISRLEDFEGLATANPPGARLLQEIRALSDSADISTALLVEHFRGTPYHKTLEKLAVWNHQIDAETLNESFDQMVTSLHREVLESAIDRLLEKAANETLNEEEKQLLSKFTRSKQALRLDALNS